MVGYALRRVGIAIVLLWILSVVTFVIYMKVPADPAGFIVDVQKATPAQLAQAHHFLGTDKPAVVQYEKYMVRLLHGDLGVSWPTVVFFNGHVEGASVGQIVWKALLVTGSLVVDGRGDPAALADRPAFACPIRRGDLHAPPRCGLATAALRREPVEAVARVRILHRQHAVESRDQGVGAVRVRGRAEAVRRRG
jgi:hypothetical protein